jgi:hypothetical protein
LILKSILKVESTHAQRCDISPTTQRTYECTLVRTGMTRCSAWAWMEALAWVQWVACMCVHMAVVSVCTVLHGPMLVTLCVLLHLSPHSWQEAACACEQVALAWPHVARASAIVRLSQGRDPPNGRDEA